MKVLKCVHVHTFLKVVVLFCILWQDVEGNPKPEHKWPPDNYWKGLYPHLFPDSSPESVHEQEQVSNHSTIFVKVYYMFGKTFSVCVNSLI